MAIEMTRAPSKGVDGGIESDEEIERLVQRARNMDDAPAYVVDDVVEVRGEHLHEPIYWTGRQWAVTEFGLESRTGIYSIPKRRLWNEEDDWGWVRQISNRPWVDMADFAEGLRLARQKWQPVCPYPLP